MTDAVDATCAVQFTRESEAENQRYNIAHLPTQTIVFDLSAGNETPIVEWPDFIFCTRI